MKRLLFTTPLVLLFLLNACTPSAGTISSTQRAAVEQTQTAESWTPVPTPTFNPNISIMVNWLNDELTAPINSLESTMDAKYNVINITYPHLPALTFRIDVNCICMNNNHCCNPERTFVVILNTLKKNSATTLGQIPNDISQIMVVSFESQSNSTMTAITASWQNIRGYLTDDVSGYQLGAQITRTIAPTMHP